MTEERKRYFAYINGDLYYGNWSDDKKNGKGSTHIRMVTITLEIILMESLMDLECILMVILKNTRGMDKWPL